MNVAVLCEQSGRVRDAFSKLGHNAVSFDILPSDTPGKHIQGDIRDFEEYILLFDIVIAFPPCTYLSVVGNRAMKEKPARRLLRQKAFEFVMWIADLYGQGSIRHVAIENPTGYLNSHWRKPDQIVHPYYFGDREMKRTCLWLINLPPLLHSDDDLFFKRTHTEKPEPSGYQKGGKKPGKPLYFTEITNRKNHHEDAKIRSTTFPGIAKAMAEQWGCLINS